MGFGTLCTLPYCLLQDISTFKALLSVKEVIANHCHPSCYDQEQNNPSHLHPESFG